MNINNRKVTLLKYILIELVGLIGIALPCFGYILGMENLFILGIMTFCPGVVAFLAAINDIIIDFQMRKKSMPSIKNLNNNQEKEINPTQYTRINKLEQVYTSNNKYTKIRK